MQAPLSDPVFPFANREKNSEFWLKLASAADFDVQSVRKLKGLLAEFPTQRNREFLADNREFFRRRSGKIEPRAKEPANSGREVADLYSVRIGLDTITSFMTCGFPPRGIGALL